MTDPDVKALAREIYRLQEQVAALSRSRQLTSSSIPITVDGDEGPEVIDVPLTAGVSQGVQAGADSKFAKDLAEQLEVTVGEAQDVLDTKIPELESAQADLESGLVAADGRIDTAQGRADAAFGKAETADGKAVAAQSVAADALALAGVSDVFIQDTAPRANLAPAIKGDGTWAEVRRNYYPYSNNEIGTTAGYEVASASVTLTNTGAQFHSGTRSLLVSIASGTTPANATVFAQSTTNRVESGQINETHSVWLRGGAGTVLQFFVQQRTAANAFIGELGTQDVTMTGGWVRANLSVAKATASNITRMGVRPTATTASVTSFYMDDLLGEASTVLQGYFDGGLKPDVPQSEDFRTRYLGAVNASESVLEIERVAGLTPTNSIAGVSTEDGKPAVLIIPTGSSDNTGAWFPIPAGDARTLATAVGTVHLDAPITGALSPTSRVIAAESPYSAKSPQAPNAGGSYPLRGEVSGLTSSYRIHLRHGGAKGSGNVRWTDIGLYPGAYDGPNLVMENILWIDTTGGNNTPKRWNGTTWAAVTDKAATDAAAAAVAAQSKANQAFDNADTALTMAGSKTQVLYSTSPPTGTAALGTLWRRQATAAEIAAGASAGDIMQEWRNTDGATTWQETRISSTAISNLDVGKLTVGTGVISDLVAQQIAARSGQFIELDVGQLNVTNVALLKEVVAEAFWSKIVTTGALYATERIITPELIALEAITTELLSADAIDGMTITGALIRTAPTGQRMQFDINGMRAFDASGAVTSTLFSGVGGMQVTGQFGVRDAGGTRENRLTYGDLTLTGDSHTAKVDLGGLAVIRSVTPGVFTEHRFDRYGFFHHWTDGVDTAQAELRLLNSTQGSVKTYRSELRVDWAAFPELQTNRISPLSGVDELVLDAPKVTFQGDTDWTTLNGWTGGFAHSSSPVQYLIKNGEVKFRGSLTNSSWSGALTSFGATMPVGARPAQTQMAQIPVNTNATIRVVQFLPNGQILLYGSAGSGAWWSFDMVNLYLN